MGDLVYVELPEAGRSIEAEKELAVVESVKAAADVYSPVSGEVTAVNEALSDNPELINKDPYGEGWIARLRPAEAEAVATQLDAAAYTEFAASEER